MEKRDQQQHQHKLQKKSQRLLPKLRRKQNQPRKKNLELLPRLPSLKVQFRRNKQHLWQLPRKSLNKLPYQFLPQRSLIQVKFLLKSKLSHPNLLHNQSQKKLKKRKRKLRMMLRKMKKRMKVEMPRKMEKRKKITKKTHECH